MEAKQDWMKPFIVSVGAGLALFGTSAVADWLLGSNLLIQFNPAFGSFEFNSAVACLALGIGLTGLGLGKNRLAVAGATIAILIGLVTLLQYLTGANLGIDEWLVKERFPAGGRPPGRMSPNAASALFVSGIGLLHGGI